MFTGRTVREFVITTPLTSLQHDFITGFDESVPYTGLIDIKYWDDKATGYPVKFNFGGKDFVVTSYVEDDIELPEPDEWNVPEECFDMSPSDYLTDMNLPTSCPPTLSASTTDAACATRASSRVDATVLKIPLI